MDVIQFPKLGGKFGRTIPVSLPTLASNKAMTSNWKVIARVEVCNLTDLTLPLTSWGPWDNPERACLIFLVCEIVSTLQDFSGD